MYSFDQIAPVTYDHQRVRFYIKFQWASPNHQVPSHALVMYQSKVSGFGISIGIIGGAWQSYDAAWNDVRLATHSWAETHPEDVKKAAGSWRR
jgi:hypothetical protein